MTYCPPRIILLLSTLLTACLPVAAKETVRLASDEWCPYVCVRDGRISGGFVVEATTRALGTMGIRVEPMLLPLNRAMRQTLAGTIDGVFAPPEDAGLRPGPVLGYSRACFFTSTRSSWSYRGLWSLKGVRLGVIGDYEYDNGDMDAFIVSHRGNRHAIDFSYGTNAGTTNAKKLLGGRFPVLLEHELVMYKLISEMKAEGRFRNAGCLENTFALRAGFSPHNKRSGKWAAALAQGVARLEKSGELARLRERHGVAATPGDGKPRVQSLF
ncbi:transporter substrate-binding domain-containing protein [Massilia sp. PAMC28688]|uniref:transporter substrate-binding domain-containing protein n=1 Tax=Massilia sp. PAMC28688 TaxID=2861283 RepID=UPI001C63349E|nr:transporter substrate-binding domain-containing protein [Massilia sp. PAMC28688]QYF94057.1 transporter substrate-binding domain-containing protein [Massilia sp. PAMC28688]